MKRRLIALLMALVLTFSLSVSAMAAKEYSANDWDGLYEAFAYDGEEQEVVITLTGDTEWYTYLSAREGKIYTINGQGFVLKEVYLGGAGDVTINADVIDYVDNDPYAALETQESVKVTVNGNITATEGDGVLASGDSTVTVNGNIDACENGVNANDSSTVIVADNENTAAVEGNITAGNDGIDAGDDSSVTVTGNITADEHGIYTTASATVDVVGDITSKEDGILAGSDSEYNPETDEYEEVPNTSTITVTGNVTSEGADGIEAGGSADITVTGDVYGGAGADGVDAADDAQVYVDGNVCGGSGSEDEVDMSDPSDYSDGGDGIEASDNAVVTVTGDVVGGNAYGTFAYAGAGVSAEGNAYVGVGGDATGGDVIADPNTAANNDEVSFAGDGVWMDSTATVMVAGNATGGNTNGDRGAGGNGVSISMVLVPTQEEADEVAGALYVYGDVAIGSGAGNATYGTAGIAMYFDDMDESDVPAVTDIQVYSITAENDLFFAAANGDTINKELTEAYAPAVKYLVNLDCSEGGGVLYNTHAAAGETVEIEVDPDAGYRLVSIVLNGAKLAVANNQASFVMPEGGGADVTVTFEKIAPPSASTTPDTGDHSNAALFGTLMLVSVLGMAVMLKGKRGKNEA